MRIWLEIMAIWPPQSVLLIDNLEYSVGYKKYTKASDRINKYKKRAERMQEREARTDLANRPQKKKRQGKVHQRS